MLLVKSAHLGSLTGLGNIRRRAGAAADDGRRFGGLEGHFLPNQGPGFWPLISMGAILAGTMRSPLTGVIFSLELTNDYHSFFRC